MVATAETTLKPQFGRWRLFRSSMQLNLRVDCDASSRFSTSSMVQKSFVPLSLGGENPLLTVQSAALPQYSRSEVLSPRFPRSHSANHPINNLDPSGHKHEKPLRPPTAAGNTKSASLKDSKVSTERSAHADHAAEGGKTSADHGSHRTKGAPAHEPHDTGHSPAAHAADQRRPAFIPKHQAVANVQKIVGTKPDGVYGPKTKLAVKTFQEKLIHDGFLKPKQADGRPSDDGLWGSATQRAYEEYEKAHGARHPAPSRPAKSAPDKATGATPAATHSAPRVAKLPPVPKPPANDSRAAREQWVRQMAVYIDAWLKAHHVRGLDGKTLAAQFAAENNWGLNKLAQVSNNWGNIKGKGPAGSEWRGAGLGHTRDRRATINWRRESPATQPVRKNENLHCRQKCLNCT